MASVNFTASLDRELLRRVKVLAAQHDTSISALLHTQLRDLVDTFEQAEQLGNSTATSLLALALGRLSDEQVMQGLQLEHEEDQFLWMAQAHLTMHRLSEQATETMVEGLHQLATSVEA